MIRSVLPHACACVALLALPAAAAAHDSRGGGASVPSRPQIQEARCVSGAPACEAGEAVRIRGEHLRAADAIVFLGRTGRGDDRRATPVSRSPHRLIVNIPRAARSGPVRILSRYAGSSRVGPRVRVAVPPPPAATPSATGGVFPILGRHDFGTEVNRFGGGRGHEGQDVFADCGTPLVAALAGTVTIAKWHSRAGNYVVINALDGTSQAYMHLQAPATVGKGDQVTAGQPIGRVGDTGRASGCHLHFEHWTAPGWYEGGSPVDPLPLLRQWARASTARRR